MYRCQHNVLELLFPLGMELKKEAQKVLHGSKKIRLHGHSWGTLIRFRLHSAQGDRGPQFVSSY